MAIIEREPKKEYVYICQDKSKLLIYGVFESKHRAEKYANGSSSIAVIKMEVV